MIKKQLSLILKISLILLMGHLCACGQTGPLYLPDQAPPIKVPKDQAPPTKEPKECVTVRPGV